MECVKYQGVRQKFKTAKLRQESLGELGRQLEVFIKY